MTDIHSHILFGVDDGSRSIEESISLLKKLKSVGFDKVILTPHFIMDSTYNSTYEDNYYRYITLKDKVKELSLGMDIYLGNELFIHEKLGELLDNYVVSSLNDTGYVLVEFPFNQYKKEYDEYLYNISLEYKIIIAHPERYHYVQENHDFVNRWLSNGYCLQCNQGSLNHKQTKNVMFKLIEQGKVSFICSDAHNEYRPLTLIDAYNTISKKFNKETADVLFKENALRVLRDEELIKLKPVKKKLF